MKPPSELTSAFRETVAENALDAGSLEFEYPSDEDALNRLRTDVRMVEAWPAAFRRMSPSPDPEDIYSIIAKAKVRAELLQETNLWRGAWDREFESLVGAVETLVGFFRGVAPRGDARNLENFKEGLAWAYQFIIFQNDSKRLALADDMPHSRKRDDPTLAFCKILCGEFQDRFGQPFCNFVGIVAGVAFGVAGSIDVKNVEAAWREEKKKRQP